MSFLKFKVLQGVPLRFVVRSFLQRANNSPLASSGVLKSKRIEIHDANSAVPPVAKPSAEKELKSETSRPTDSPQPSFVMFDATDASNVYKGPAATKSIISDPAVNSIKVEPIKLQTSNTPDKSEASPQPGLPTSQAIPEFTPEFPPPAAKDSASPPPPSDTSPPSSNATSPPSSSSPPPSNAASPPPSSNIPVEHNNDQIKKPEESQGIVWLDNVLPLKIFKYDPRMHIIQRYYEHIQKNLEAEAQHMIPKTFAAPFKIEKIMPNIKDGGMMLYFSYKGAALDAIEQIKAHLTENAVRGPYTWARVHAFEVKGEPWVEDLEHRLPSNRLKIEFSGPDLPLEMLYKEFRVFGSIVDIFPMSPSSKDLPRFAVIEYKKYRSAASARNCLYLEEMAGTKIRLSYLRPLSEGVIWNSITQHPRLSAPIILALIAGLSYLIFDPIRLFFISNEITDRLTFKHLWQIIRPYTQTAERLADKTVGYFLGSSSERKQDDATNVQEIEQERQRLERALGENPETVILVQGVSGNAKSDLVKDATKGFQNMLYIDLDDMIGQSDPVMLDRLASSVGYFPLFGWLNSVSSLADTVITSTTGKKICVKAGLASTNDVQFRHILETVTVALNSITTAQRTALDKYNAKYAMVENAPPAPEMDYPVVVIDGFFSKEKGNTKGHTFVYEIAAEWGVFLAENSICHVVFVTDSPSAYKSLTKQTPKPIVAITLADASLASSMQYVTRRLGFGYNAEELMPMVAGLGGRVSDLDLFTRKIKSGSKPADAYADIVSRAVSELRKIGFEDRDDGKKLFTTPQFWHIIKNLAEHEEIGFDEVRFNPLFKGDETPLSALERTGIIVLVSEHNRPYKIRTGKPLFRVAFQNMLTDTNFVATMSILTLKSLKGDEEAKVKSLQQQMVELSASLATKTLPYDARRELEIRANTVSQLLASSNKKLMAWETEIKKHEASLAL
ncbi:hypothetical protein SmJEL517_g04776 [Synchytrium microbalum]|uniref:Mitochondrial escape protein 2 n=1 Tax=Synchytrium microbalum TaxID=1806994 RepID=A0A507BYV5_9FUNG|nr:uncharacterized protein SmJEL517_g04776 [Synchytrium microbalum]TPX32039.1 hypothetical protein SmJEL517_g04776 [Synchytrium microbalum]